MKKILGRVFMVFGVISLIADVSYIIFDKFIKKDDENIGVKIITGKKEEKETIKMGFVKNES